MRPRACRAGSSGFVDRSRVAQLHTGSVLSLYVAQSQFAQTPDFPTHPFHIGMCGFVFRNMRRNIG